MSKMFTLTETREMSESKIQMELGECAKMIDALGMDHEDTCKLISSIMNLGIAIHEKNQRKKYVKFKEDLEL